MDHESVRLLRERFDLGHGEAEHILGSFVDAVERSLEEYGICHVTGIGSFVRAPGDRHISFEPADALTRAVNVRFADLPVYEIDADDSPDRSAAAEQVMSMPTTEGAAISPGAAETSDSEPEPEPEHAEDTGESTAEPRAASTEEAEDSAGTSVGPVDEPDASSPSQADADKGTSPEAVEETEPTVPSRAASRGPRRRDEKASRGVRTAWIVLPLLVVVAVAAVWLMQRPAGPESDTESMANQSTPAAQTPAMDVDGEEDEPTTDQGTSGEESTDARTPADERNTDDARSTDDAQAVRQTPTSPETVTDAGADDGDREYALDRSVDGYTMIVGSSPDLTAADEQISRFTELDLPFGVLDYSEDGSPMYRLAVGLFDSAEHADSARQAMADTLPSGTWVWRIR